MLTKWKNAFLSVDFNLSFCQLFILLCEMQQGVNLQCCSKNTFRRIHGKWEESWIFTFAFLCFEQKIGISEYEHGVSLYSFIHLSICFTLLTGACDWLKRDRGACQAAWTAQQTPAAVRRSCRVWNVNPRQPTNRLPIIMIYAFMFAYNQNRLIIAYKEALD